MKMETVDVVGIITSWVVAGLAGLVGIITGIKVHGTKIESLEERLTRMEDKLDRLIERHLR